LNVLLLLEMGDFSRSRQFWWRWFWNEGRVGSFLFMTNWTRGSRPIAKILPRRPRRSSFVVFRVSSIIAGLGLSRHLPQRTSLHTVWVRCVYWP